MAKKFNVKRIVSRVGGAAAGGVVSQVSNKVLGNFDPKISGAIKVAAGAILPELAPKSDFVSQMGSGLIGAAAAGLVGALVPSLAGVEGIGSEEYITDEEYMSGIDDENAIAGDDDNAIQGIGEEEEEAF